MVRIVHQPLDTPDIEACRRLYGITFIKPRTQQLDRFHRLCDKLLVEQKRILDAHDTNLTPVKPAIVYDPSAFLATKLTTEQVTAINEQEAPQVAAYCVAKQAELAKIPIKESGERLLHIPTTFKDSRISATFSDIPFPELSGKWANRPQEFWAREGFAKRLVIMGQLLNSVNTQPHFVEAFRPVGVQESMYKRRVARTRREYPTWSKSQVLAEARSKTAYTPRFASHKGAAAADILLRDIRSSELLDFGHEYPDGGVLVFPRTPYITAEQWHNRQLLQVCAGLSGLTLYFGEDWHISFGDNLASLDESGRFNPKYVAQYGPIKDFDRQSGEITARYSHKEMDREFDP